MLAQPDAFAPYVATLGRGPGKSRALTRAEARAAFGMVLAGEVDPHQLGAFLMLLRYRGEDADEITGIVEAIQDATPPVPPATLDWPSYGSGRTRDLPWFLLSALALGRSGERVLMHGTNEFGQALAVADALQAIGRAAARTADEAATLLDADGFAYLPAEILCAPAANLLGLRRLFGLRSPVNTAVRLLDPARAPGGVDGVFHPAYLDVHLGVAERLGRPRLLVLKGGGGEAERVPAKPGVAYLWDAASGRAEIPLPVSPVPLPPEPDGTPALFRAVWDGGDTHPRILATVLATIALGLIARGRDPDDAARVWSARHG